MFWKLRDGPAKYRAESLAIAVSITINYLQILWRKLISISYPKNIVIMRKQRHESTIKSTIESVGPFKHDE